MFKICRKVTANNFVIYLLQCYICKIQYVGKAETLFNNRPNNRRKYVKNPKAISACKHFYKHDHNFDSHGRLIIIEQVRNITTTSAETPKKNLRSEKTSG